MHSKSTSHPFFGHNNTKYKSPAPSLKIIYIFFHHFPVKSAALIRLMFGLPEPIMLYFALDRPQKVLIRGMVTSVVHCRHERVGRCFAVETSARKTAAQRLSGQMLYSHTTHTEREGGSPLFLSDGSD